MGGYKKHINQNGHMSDVGTPDPELGQIKKYQKKKISSNIKGSSKEKEKEKK